MSDKKTPAQKNAEALQTGAKPGMSYDEALAAFADDIAAAEKAKQRWQIVMPMQAGASPSLRVDL